MPRPRKERAPGTWPAPRDNSLFNSCLTHSSSELAEDTTSKNEYYPCNDIETHMDNTWNHLSHTQTGVLWSIYFSFRPWNTLTFTKDTHTHAHVVKTSPCSQLKKAIRADGNTHSLQKSHGNKQNSGASAVTEHLDFGSHRNKENVIDDESCHIFEEKNLAASHLESLVHTMDTEDTEVVIWRCLRPFLGRTLPSTSMSGDESSPREIKKWQG